MLCAPFLQLYWALLSYLVRLHLKYCAFSWRASAEISPLSRGCTSVCVFPSRDAWAADFSVHLSCKWCQHDCHYDTVCGCFPRGLHMLVSLDCFVDALRADFSCRHRTAGMIFAWDCCRTAFFSFRTASMLAVVAEQCSDHTAFVAWYCFWNDLSSSYQTAGVIFAWDCWQTVFCILRTAGIARATLCGYRTTCAVSRYSRQTACAIIMYCEHCLPHSHCACMQPYGASAYCRSGN